MQESYVASLPAWVRLWMSWMSLVLVLSVVFAWKKREARWVLAMVLVLVPLTALWGLAVGWNRLWGMTHIVLWTPLVVYLWRRFRAGHVRLEGGWFDRAYAVWLAVAAVTMAVSLLFDYTDVARHLLGAG